MHREDEAAMDAGARSLIDQFVHLKRVQAIFDRYCREGKRPTREEAKAWLESEGWKPYPLANLLRQWGYDAE